MNYNILNVNLSTLGQNLGLNYNQLIKYRHENPVKYNEALDLSDTVWSDKGIGYKKGQVFGLPILNRYAILSYVDPASGTKTELLLETIIISVERSHNIVKNSVVGVEGTLKEYVSAGDYIIDMTGSLIGANAANYDDESIEKFQFLMNTKEEIQVVCSFLNDYFKVSDIVIENYKLMQSPDFTNIVFFTISASSDLTENKIISQTI